ncbi:HNH endonuclease signature motif containing protein [Shewanella algae]|uniref:HNH endonuclease signature motif containing protein n=1 Tax=Shewanella algae TaxID=38313 RepID=UPI001C7F4725|nr:HNH endonuclease signature motif containing protein [Shewanella algae]
MARPSIPETLKRKLLYDSQYVCVVCQSRGTHIHHINGDHSDNREDNLVVLCVAHHDEAHTKRELSQNLSPGALQHAKSEWNATVSIHREQVVTTEGQLALPDAFPLGGSPMWGYINHRRVIQIASPTDLYGDAKFNFELCLERGLVDRNGILLKPSNRQLKGNYITNSIYDWFEFGDDHRVHKLYSDFVNLIAERHEVKHLEPLGWSKARVRSLIQEGSIFFTEKALYFKTLSETQENQHRLCYGFKNNVRLEFLVDTRDMFGTSSMTVSFSGHQSCSALLVAKSLNERDGHLILSCSPLALGVGFESVVPFSARPRVG